MVAIAWDASLETGDATIDSQHKQLFSLVNELRDACVEDRGDAATRSILARLGDYVATHFSAEQALMVKSRYPVDQMVAHIAAHASLSQRTAEIISQHDRGELVTVLPLAEFLTDWLRSHIRQTDKAFVVHMRTTAEAG
jgi:hemerythrin-like metal-binding protein